MWIAFHILLVITILTQTLDDAFIAECIVCERVLL